MNNDEIKTEDEAPPLFFKRKEAYLLSTLTGLVALVIECFVLFVAEGGGGRAKLLIIIPVAAIFLIGKIFTNTRSK